MSYRLGMKSKSRRGFTLTEMLVALAILGVIAPAMGMSIFQVLSLYSVNAKHMVAVKQVENAVHWISRDAQMAQTVQTQGVSGFPLTLTWVEWDNTSNNVTYTIQNGELRRAYSINNGQPTSRLVAQHMNPDSAATNCQFVSGNLTFMITASIGGFKPVSEARLGEVIPKSR
jgi:prepilin-type N-terminal cleavage/methylation domain-containing protein